MPQVVRSRIRALHVPPPVAPLPHRFRSLADREAVAVLHRAAHVLLESLPELTDRLVEALREQEPAYRTAIETEPAEIWQEVHHSLRHNIASLIQPREFRDAAHRTSRWIGETRAEQGVPLDAVMHAFRMGGAMVWQDLVDETARRYPEDVRLLVHVAADVWNFVDEHCGVVAEAYRQAERRLTWRRENQQRLMTAALLDGTARIADLPDAAAVLGLPVQGRYAVLAVATARRAPHGTDRPPLTLPEGTPVLWHTGGDVELAVLPLGTVPVAAEEPAPGEGEADADTTGTPPGTPRQDELAAVAAELAAPPGTRIGISSVVDGLASVGDARRLAETALRACPASGGTVLLDEHLPAALVVSSPGLGTALADRVLGPLDRIDPADRDVIIETLTAWLDSDGSAQRAGARLYCHRNTVLNRLRRFEQLTGRCLTRPSDAVEVSLALAARQLLGG
ncbi:helix-turn-helix domain-containing protein [Streptomyces sp. NBC_01520]|uniref:helix-turn-helix domain-containing protein n=1 Tax=Streptomyces sp. NBC_01520 TaxID=2903892 RepID=UPI00386445C8